MKSSAKASDDILTSFGKIRPIFPREAGFHREAISSTEGGFIPSARTDLVEKSQVLRLGFFPQGQKDSNPRHPVLETGVLPTELYPYARITLYHINLQIAIPFLKKFARGAILFTIIT